MWVCPIAPLAVLCSLMLDTGPVWIGLNTYSHLFADDSLESISESRYLSWAPLCSIGGKNAMCLNQNSPPTHTWSYYSLNSLFLSPCPPLLSPSLSPSSLSLISSSFLHHLLLLLLLSLCLSLTLSPHPALSLALSLSEWHHHPPEAQAQSLGVSLDFSLSLPYAHRASHQTPEPSWPCLPSIFTTPFLSTLQVSSLPPPHQEGNHTSLIPISAGLLLAPISIKESF